MNFAHPLAWLLLLLLIPVVFLYWLRVRMPRVVVGTGFFWLKALAEETVRSRWQRWRPRISLALEILIVVLLTLAAAGPQIPRSDRIIIDNTATMRASDVQPTRLEVAKAVARRLIESKLSSDESDVIAMGPTPHEVQPMTNDKALLFAAVDSIQATDAPANIDWAVKLAHEVSAPDEEQIIPALRGQIALITDASASEAAMRAQGSDAPYIKFGGPNAPGEVLGPGKNGVQVLRVGTLAGNRAISRFTARRSKVDPTNCEVLVEVQNMGNRPADGNVTITVNDKNSDSAAFSIPKNGNWQHVFPAMNLPGSGRLTAKIDPSDDYVFDDTATFDMPAAPARHRVRLVEEAPSGLKEILMVSPRVELIQDAAQSNALQVINGKRPPVLPAGPLLVFTPSACDMWQLGKSVADPLVTRADENTPITTGLQLHDVYLPEARQLIMAESFRNVAKPILWAGTAPLAYAIDRPQGRIVVIAGDLATSNLPLQAAFPQLIGQSLDWLEGQVPWNDEVIASARENQEIGRIGRIGPPAFGELAAADLRVPIGLGIGYDASQTSYGKPRPPLWIYPAALAAVLLVFEWCLYQRRWTS